MTELTLTQRVVRTARQKYGVDILTRDQWSAQYEEVYAWRRVNRKVTTLKADTVVQHITVTRPTGNFPADVRTVEKIGYERFGSGVSYNFVVNMATGQVAVGMPLDAKGTHTVNDKDVPGFSYDQNAVARAIAVLGMESTPLSPKAQRAISGLLAAMIDEGAATETFDYVPHSLFAYKDCPCAPTRNAMPNIRKAALELRKK